MAHKPISLSDELSLTLESLALAIDCSIKERDDLRAINAELLAALVLLLNARASGALHMEAHWLPARLAIARAESGRG
jgi:hypothetical protein